MTLLWQLSAIDQAAGVREGRFTARTLVESVLERVALKNPELNAIVDPLAEQALLAADKADAAVASGEQLGCLHGVPVTVKVNVDTKGRPTTNGMEVFKDVFAPDNSPIVQNLLNAGAIIIGRTNTPEMSMRLTTDNPLYGLTRNPWSLDMSPGGSSGGAAASAAAGFGAIHHGNDIAGSLRYPATACGLSTIKPGLGRVPAYLPSAKAERGMLAQLMSVQGVVCREVKDVRLATQVLMRHDPRDPWHVPMPFSQQDSALPKIAYCKEAHGYPIHKDIVENLDRAASILEAAGYQVEETETPSIAEAAKAWLQVTNFEMKRTLEPVFKEHGSAIINQIFEGYYQLEDMVDAEGYLLGIAERTRMVREWNLLLADYPLVLTPYLMRPGYPSDYDETFEGVEDLFRSSIYSYGVNYIGMPAGHVPVDLVDEMPSGVQLIGQKWREDLILDAMEVIENATGVMTRKLWDRE
ncbi:amidase [Gammaproteobacteria bacterium]|jgi:amidase|nr:amidase [Gammaproteobacteria bacterium]MBT7225822.1 amidase [Gammaproteobacteria bacterium]MDC0414368.1 amidase [Gammaproteobacteria bacterium]MDC3196658.1 amidase [Gammaproteobacteria bacterium]